MEYLHLLQVSFAQYRTLSVDYYSSFEEISAFRHLVEIHEIIGHGEYKEPPLAIVGPVQDGPPLVSSRAEIASQESLVR